jgi:hypothetical protein
MIFYQIHDRYSSKRGEIGNWGPSPIMAVRSYDKVCGDRRVWLLRQVYHRAIAGRGSEGLHTHEFPAQGEPVRRTGAGIPFHFDKPDLLARSLEGVEVLVNTYWVRDHADTLGRQYASELARRTPARRG